MGGLSGHIYDEVRDVQKMSLEEALGRADIDPEGRFHDGLNDAVNTGLLIEKLELNPDYHW